MREIKFRAWNSDDKKMIYRRDGMIDSRSVITILKNVPVAGGTWRCEIDKEFNGILMQYTGLKDKNGKEIYEGDIVKWDHGVHRKNKQDAGISEVIFNEGCFYLKDEYAFNCLLEMEVIGNIYENPELLEVKQ